MIFLLIKRIVYYNYYRIYYFTKENIYEKNLYLITQYEYFLVCLGCLKKEEQT